MPKLEHLICRCACRKPAAKSKRMILTVKGSARFGRVLRELRRRGIHVHHAFPGSRMLCCHLKADAPLHRLLAHPHLIGLEPDRRASALSRPARSRVRALSVPKGTVIGWNIRRVQAPNAWTASTGKGVSLAVLDTGCGPHPALRIAGGTNTIGGTSYRDDNGHGTHAAGIAAAIFGTRAGVAPEVRLYAVKVLGRDGTGYVSDIIEGLEWCLSKRIRVASMSFGLAPGVRSLALERTVRRAQANGLLMVAAAGNAGASSGGLDAPASYPGVLAVAASTKSDRIASFSSRGRGIGLTAPGENIVSAWPPSGWRSESGTSMATPHAAGGAALLLQLQPGLKPAGAIALLEAQQPEAERLSALAQGSGLLQLGFLARLKPSTASGKPCLPAHPQGIKKAPRQ